jgi:hypothetical protein
VGDWATQRAGEVCRAITGITQQASSEDEEKTGDGDRKRVGAGVVPGGVGALVAARRSSLATSACGSLPMAGHKGPHSAPPPPPPLREVCDHFVRLMPGGQSP